MNEEYQNATYMTVVCTLVGGPFDGRAARISVMNTRGALFDGRRYERVGNLLLYTGDDR
jgi:hypothetical protein